ncbi:MAG: thiamine-phosphate kinase [Nitrospiraceae bacterium]
MPARSQPQHRRRFDEFGFIKELHHRFGRTGRSVTRGIGDDAAAVRLSRRLTLLITTDLLAEHIHFSLATATFQDVGYKAAVANLSDIAAMGGTPNFVVSAIAIPPVRRQWDITEIYRGLMAACRTHGVELVGGDTSASDRDLFLSITMIGTVSSGHVLRREGARVGDLLYVTGTLGDSLAGLDLLGPRPTHRASLKTRRTSLLRRDIAYLTGRHLRPTPRIKEGQSLSRSRLATAAIDLSDGLSGDLVHLCEQSGVGAEIDASALPLSPACRRYGEARGLDTTALALKGGEDYELLFTVSPKQEAAINRLMRKTGYRFSRIGTIRSRSFGRRIRAPSGAVRPLPVLSYRHFQDP